MALDYQVSPISQLENTLEPEMDVGQGVLNRRSAVDKITMRWSGRMLSQEVRTSGF